MTILADHPARSSTAAPDLLSLESRLSVVFDILRHKETNCPITVAVYGDWGTGKTSAMRWLEAELIEWNKRSSSEREEHPRVYPVWFDPWKYHSREDVWRGIIAEVILSLFSVKSLDRQNLVPRMTQAAKKFGAFLGKSFLHALGAIEVKASADVLGTGAEVTIKGEMFRDIYDEFESTNRPEKPFLNEFERTLEEWVGGFLQRDGDKFLERMVLFIDDLDRCSPDVTLEVLEAIKLYLNIRPMTFVVGLDRAVVDALVAKNYDAKGLDPRKSEQFLDKIFQVEIQIPPSEAQMQGFLDQQISALDVTTDGYWSTMLHSTNHRNPLEEGIRHLAQYNPRETKRILNSTLLRGRAAADNRNLQEKFQDNNLLFAQGVQFFLVQRFVRNKMSSATRLLLGKQALVWFERLSEFLRAHPEFAPPSRRVAPGAEKPDIGESHGTPQSEAEELYGKLRADRPSDDEGRPIDIVLLEDLILWDILRIPFSAEVAQSASALEPRRASSVGKTVAVQQSETSVGADALRSLPSVIRDRIALGLNKTVDQLTTADIIELDELDLADSQIGDGDLQGLPVLKSLRMLMLNRTQLTDAAIPTIIERAPSLRALYIGHTNITDDGVARLALLTPLRTLRLDGTQTTKKTLDWVVGSPIDLLWLSGDHVTDEWMAQLGQKESLAGIHLINTKVTDVGVRYLTKFESMWVLDLEGTAITDGGLREIARLKNLEMLYLSGSNISDASLRVLSGLTKLSILKVNHTALTDESVPVIASLGNLTSIGLRGTKMSQSGIANLRLALPKADIET